MESSEIPCDELFAKTMCVETTALSNAAELNRDCKNIVLGYLGATDRQLHEQYMKYVFTEMIGYHRFGKKQCGKAQELAEFLKRRPNLEDCAYMVIGFKMMMQMRRFRLH